MQSDPPNIVITQFPKSVGISLILTILFGASWNALLDGHGRSRNDYPNDPGRSLHVRLWSFLMWPMSLVWGAIAAKDFNKQLFLEAGSSDRRQQE